MAEKKKKARAKRPVSKNKVKAKPKKARKVLRRKTPKAKKRTRKPPVVIEEGVLVGRVTHYFPHVKAGAIMIANGEIFLGDTVRIKGHTTDFKQKIASMQIDRNPIEKASKGQEIGILVKSRVRIHDKVYKI